MELRNSVGISLPMDGDVEMLLKSTFSPGNGGAITAKKLPMDGDVEMLLKIPSAQVTAGLSP